VSAFVFTSAYASLAALALAMDRYQAQLWRQRPSSRTKALLQALGMLGLLLSVGACVVELDWSLGIVSWLGVAMVASLVLALALTYWPRRIVLCTGLAWLLAGAAGLASW
jgi:protein-S-isoprenylcysteine O-methyltransferase Ste14